MRIPIRQDADKLSKPAARLLSRIGSGLLVKQYVQDDRVTSGVMWCIEPGAKAAPPEDAEELIRKGRLQPRNDGLFPGESQTYSADQD